MNISAKEQREGRPGGRTRTNNISDRVERKNQTGGTHNEYI